MGPQVGPRYAHDGPKMVSRSSQEYQDRAKLAPRWPREVPVGPKMVSKGTKMVSRAIIMAFENRFEFEKWFLKKKSSFPCEKSYFLGVQTVPRRGKTAP